MAAYSPPKERPVSPAIDREPQPGDGPEYRADHAAWERRHPPVSELPDSPEEPTSPYRAQAIGVVSEVLDERSRRPWDAAYVIDALIEADLLRRDALLAAEDEHPATPEVVWVVSEDEHGSEWRIHQEGLSINIDFLRWGDRIIVLPPLDRPAVPVDEHPATPTGDLANRLLAIERRHRYEGLAIGECNTLKEAAKVLDRLAAPADTE